MAQRLEQASIPKKILIKYKNPFIHGSLLFRKKSLEDIGCYDEYFYYSQDYKLIIDLIDNGCKYKILKEPLYILNMSDNISNNFKDKQEYFAECARKGIIPDFQV